MLGQGRLLPKSELTNSCRLKICKSVICSPNPMYLTGILNWSDMPITTPPFAVPSSLVTASAVTCVARVNCFACSNAFCPVLPSKTSSTSLGAVGTIFCMTFLILVSSFMRLILLCSRPAVSMITTSASLALADCSVSKATDAGSAPICCLITGTPMRSPHISSCSVAAARKVSAAPR